LTIRSILNWLNTNEPAREKFELSYKNLSLLWETLHPDRFLVEHEANYLWLSRVWMYYVKAFYKSSSSKFETDPADGAKTRELIRQHVDVDQIKNDLPTYVLDTDYLTKIKDDPPDSKALDNLIAQSRFDVVSGLAGTRSCRYRTFPRIHDTAGERVFRRRSARTRQRFHYPLHQALAQSQLQGER
jgi:hypothetical protein